jgi:hypothetical protein
MQLRSDMQLKEDLTHYTPRINIRVTRADNEEILYQGHNVIVNVVKWLFARLMANSIPNTPNPPYALGETSDTNSDPFYGVWGLALGAGSPGWAPETQPDPTPVQTAVIQQILRKPLSRVNYVDANFNPLSTFSTMVDFQTTVNATTDNITQGIREMGLIGGGTINNGGPTNMLTAPFFDPAGTSGPGQGPNPNSVVLINYKTLPPLILPAGVDIIFSWVLSF